MIKATVAMIKTLLSKNKLIGDILAIIMIFGLIS